MSLSLFAVVLIEAAVLKRVSRSGWSDALTMALRANLFTAFIGFLLIAHPLELFGVLLILAATWRGAQLKGQDA